MFMLAQFLAPSVASSLTAVCIRSVIQVGGIFLSKLSNMFRDSETEK